MGDSTPRERARAKTPETFDIDNPAHLCAARDMAAVMAPLDELPWPYKDGLHSVIAQRASSSRNYSQLRKEGPSAMAKEYRPSSSTVARQ